MKIFSGMQKVKKLFPIIFSKKLFDMLQPKQGSKPRQKKIYIKQDSISGENKPRSTWEVVKGKMINDECTSDLEAM